MMENLVIQNYKGQVTFDNVIDYVNRGINYFRKNTANPHFFLWSDNFDDIEKYFVVMILHILKEKILSMISTYFNLPKIL